MFKDNKYTKHYWLLINKAQNRKLPKEIYKERHHIIPQSLGGNNDKSNLVWLTGREHALCHWALTKMVEGDAKSKMIYAFNGMNAANKFHRRYQSRIISRAYERNRVEHARIHSEVMKSKNLVPWNKDRKLEGEELKIQRERMRNRVIDPVKQAEGQQKRISKIIGQKRTEETRLKMSLAHRGQLKGPMSEEEKIKRSVKLKGVKKPKDHADKVRVAVIGNISVNKDGVEKKVKKDVVDQYLNEGWSLGGRKRKSV